MIAHENIHRAQAFADACARRLGVTRPCDVRGEEWLGRTPDGGRMRAGHVYRRGRHTIFLDRRALDAIGTVGGMARIAHEIAHARQCEDHGAASVWEEAYAAEIAARGYARNRFEIEARAIGARLAATWAAAQA
jgi:hypothetical protein